MSLFLEKKELFDGILLLTEEEIQNPVGVFERFFSDYRLHECRHNLWVMVKTCITTENDQFDSPEERANLLHRQKDFERLLEACTLLLKRPKKTPASPVSEPKAEK
ncbi:hypothetical protein [Puia dinghuensis]|uniref:Uncharacterized protein n=1 Tax=Puia dinghuensis TaxID=1792502 RepID=A0A8J2UGF8_9BACT|nr:hypothetical protein [Puia dinghuensis]GGB14078.1 hypothetical protein GCM10011511_42290 [Puia dinghuensis]